MGDGLKLSKDKRHKSSSSLAGAGLEGTRSERKLDIRTLIPEGDDHFILAESRCKDLQEKIDLVKVLKRKKKFNKRSMTRVNEQPTVTENVPFISVRTQPKKKMCQQAARLRRLEVPPNPTRGYLDPATVEQHRMLGQVWGYGQNHNQNIEGQPEQKPYSRLRPRRNHPDGDGQLSENPVVQSEVTCSQEDNQCSYSDNEPFDHSTEDFIGTTQTTIPMEDQENMMAARRRNYLREKNLKEVPKWIDATFSNQPQKRKNTVPRLHRRQHQEIKGAQRSLTVEERPIVELYNKTSNLPLTPRPQSKKEDKRTKKDQVDYGTEMFSRDKMYSSSKNDRSPYLVKYRSHGYEMPTVASEMKRVDFRSESFSGNCANIPFVVSKSTAPSHNIGVNIQQVLNGIKVQQPLEGIPSTMAHHMGLEHVPANGTGSEKTNPQIDSKKMNALKLGQRLLKLPSKVSYNRLLCLYGEGDGMVPRFLRAMKRPSKQYFSRTPNNTSMRSERGDRDGATTPKVRRRLFRPNAREQQEEYLSLYRNYLEVMQELKTNSTPELELKRDELLAELDAREDFHTKMVEECNRLLGVSIGFPKGPLYGAEVDKDHPLYRPTTSTSGDQPI